MTYLVGDFAPGDLCRGVFNPSAEVWLNRLRRFYGFRDLTMEVLGVWFVVKVVHP